MLTVSYDKITFVLQPNKKINMKMKMKKMKMKIFMTHPALHQRREKKTGKGKGNLQLGLHLMPAAPTLERVPSQETHKPAGQKVLALDGKVPVLQQIVRLLQELPLPEVEMALDQLQELALEEVENV
jgi:hypothetical protein